MYSAEGHWILSIDACASDVADVEERVLRSNKEAIQRTHRRETTNLHRESVEGARTTQGGAPCRSTSCRSTSFLCSLRRARLHLLKSTLFCSWPWKSSIWPIRKLRKKRKSSWTNTRESWTTRNSANLPSHHRKSVGHLWPFVCRKPRAHRKRHRERGVLAVVLFIDADSNVPTYKGSIAATPWLCAFNASDC